MQGEDFFPRFLRVYLPENPGIARSSHARETFLYACFSVDVRLRRSAAPMSGFRCDDGTARAILERSLKLFL